MNDNCGQLIIVWHFIYKHIDSTNEIKLLNLKTPGATLGRSMVRRFNQTTETEKNK